MMMVQNFIITLSFVGYIDQSSAFNADLTDEICSSGVVLKQIGQIDCQSEWLSAINCLFAILKQTPQDVTINRKKYCAGHADESPRQKKKSRFVSNLEPSGLEHGDLEYFFFNN